MVKYLLKKSYQLKDLKEINFNDLWGDQGVFTTMWIYGRPSKILFFKNHINNQLEWINKFSVTGWNGKNMYVLQEGSMYNYHAGFTFLRVPSNSNREVWVNLGTCFKQPCTDAKNQLETQISFYQW